MKTRLFILITAGMLVFGLMTALAHHAIVSTYDFKKDIKLDGTMVLMLFRNPHAFVHIDVPDEQGVLQRWAIEWGGASQLGGQGITRNTFKPGDHVIITGNPSRTPGERRMKMNTLTRPKDGFVWGLKPGEVVD
jgi:hypothetical protein